MTLVLWAGQDNEGMAQLLMYLPIIDIICMQQYFNYLFMQLFKDIYKVLFIAHSYLKPSMRRMENVLHVYTPSRLILEAMNISTGTELARKVLNTKKIVVLLQC